MKRLSISASVIILAIFVLLGSGGFTVGKMICGGNECASTYTLGKAKDCCAGEKAPVDSQVKSCCCELVNVAYNLDEFSVSEKVNVSAQEFQVFFSSEVLNFPLPSSIIHLPSPDPSPPDAQDYLHFIGSLLL